MRWSQIVDDLRGRTGRAWLADGLVAAAVTSIALGNLIRQPADPRWLAILGTALLVVPLLFRRIWPVPVFVVVVVAAAVFGAWDIRLAANLALPVALYTVASVGARTQALGGAVVLEVIALITAVRLPGSQMLAAAVLLTGMVAAALGLGLYQATRRAYVRELVDRAERLEYERDQTNELAAAAERARIAREMHDIVAHHLTVMIAVSDGAARLATADPVEAAQAMRTVSATGRDALRDTRRLLGVLGTEDPHDSSAATHAEEDRRPLPGVVDLEALIDQVRSAGLPVDLRVTGAPEPLAADTQLAVYRLVQESLTNTLKHSAGQTRATITMTRSPDGLDLLIDDNGAVRPSGPDPKPGRGISGMTARVHAVGGTVSAGPFAPHGWRVHARIPLQNDDLPVQRVAT